MAHTECKKYVMCPMCKGRSATRTAAETTSLSIQHENANSSQVAKTQFVEATYSGASGDLHFPTLSNRITRTKISTHLIFETISIVFDDFTSFEQLTNAFAEETWLDKITIKYPKDVNPTAIYGDYAPMLESDCVETQEEFASPHEALKHAMQSLKQDQWQSSVSALTKLMHISRIQPELLDSNMPRIYRTLCSLLRNTRPHVVRTACQVAMELYKTVQCTQRPEFDELASTLLLKSTHTNKGIRNEAQRALDSMVSHLPPATCIRILTNEHSASHKNPLIRATVSRLIYNIINIIGVECLLSNPNLKDIRRKIFTMCTKFLLDGNNETRNDAKKTLKAMMSHPDFDILFYQDVDWKIISSVEKQLVSLKYSQIHTV